MAIWNHTHILKIIHKAVGSRSGIKATIGRLYKCSMDISFKKSGGLFVILDNESSLAKLVNEEDIILNKKKRSLVDYEFDYIFTKKRNINKIDRKVIMGLSAIDGALIMNTNGKLLTYGSVINSWAAKKRHEGSRTQAAIFASKYGTCFKISSDGDITVYRNGNQVIKI